MDASSKTSALDAVHRAAGARFAEFGGWSMPLQYPDGVLAEHRACREDAAIFDVSHLGSLRVVGPGALDGLQRAFTNDLDRIGPGRAQYTHLLDVDDAHVVDDVIVWWLAHEELIVMPNASNTAPLLSALNEELGGRGRVEDITPTRAVLAVQGPSARRRLAGVSEALAGTGRFAVADVEWRGHTCVVAGTGYTGEDGVEIHVPSAGAEALWQSLVATGATPAGLGARDTLRLEMGYPLHGHELGPGITPLQARLDRVVRFDKGEFRGRESLLAERERGPARLLRGLRVHGRQVPRTGCVVRHGGDTAGEVTSGNFSPTLGHSIALALLPPGLTPGTEVEIQVRDRTVAATVTDPPFLRR